MDRKKKLLLTFACAIAAVLLLRFVGIHAPSGAKVVFSNVNTGVSFEEPLSEAEAVAVKRILWGRIRWPELLYGSPACGFGRNYAIIIDGTRYMPAWDSCGVLCVEDASSDTGPSSYINITDAQREVIKQIFDARGAG